MTTMANYSVNIRPLGPFPQTPCQPFDAPGSCNRPGRYVVTSDYQGGGGGANLCPEHLFPGIAYLLGLPKQVPG